MSNLGATYLDAGESRRAVLWQKRAIRKFAKQRRPMNEAIAWIGLAHALMESGDSASAWKACEKAEMLAEQAQYRRGAWDAAVTKAELLVQGGKLHRAAAELKRARKGFQDLNICEAPIECTAAQIARLEGHLVKAQRHIAAGLKLARKFPVEQARLLAEAATLERTRGCIREAERLDRKRLAILKRIQAV